MFTQEAMCQMSHKYETLQREHEHLQRQFLESEFRVKNSCCEIKSLQCELQRKLAEVEKLEKTVVTLNAFLSKRDETISNLEQTIAGLNKQVSELRCQVEERCKHKPKHAEDYISNHKRMEKEIETLKCEIKWHEEYQKTLKDCCSQIQTKFEQTAYELQALKDPNNVKTAMEFIEKTMEDNQETNFCNRSVAQVGNFLKQEVTCFQRVLTSDQGEGLLKIAQLLLAKVRTDKEHCEAYKIVEEKSQQVCSLTTELKSTNCQTTQIIEELQSSVKKLDGELKNKTISSKQLEEALCNHSNKLQELERKLQEEQGRSEKLAVERQAVESDLKTRLEQVTHKLKHTDDDLRSKTQACQQLEESLEMADCQVQTVQVTMEKEKRSLDDCMRKLQEFQVRCQTSESKVSDLEKSVDQLRTQNEKYANQVDAFIKLETYVERIAATFMANTNYLASKYGPKLEYNQLEPCTPKSVYEKFEEFEKRLEFVVFLAKTSPENKNVAECIRADLIRKDQQLGEMVCCLQQAQAKVCEQEQKVEAVERQLKDTCCRLECCRAEVEQEKQNCVRLENLVAELECQLQELCQIQQMCECLQQKVKELEKQLCFEQENGQRCHDAYLEADKNCKILADELKSKEECCSVLTVQVKRQDCEIKALNGKLRTLQDSGPYKGTGRC